MCTDAARAHKRVDTCGFHPLVNLPFPLEGLAQTRDRRPLRKRERQSDYSYMTFSAFSQFTDSVLLHIRLAPRRGRHDSAAQFFLRVIPPGTCGFRCLAQFIFVGAVCNLQTNELRDTGMSRLRRLSGLCGSNVSGTANRLRKTRKKKSSAVPNFGAVTCR